jgi:hypothetical protein
MAEPSMTQGDRRARGRLTCLNLNVVRSPTGFPLAFMKLPSNGNTRPLVNNAREAGCQIVPAVFSGRRLGLPSLREYFLGHP